MAELPGAFIGVNLGIVVPTIVNPPDTSGINRAVVMHLDGEPVPERFTRWITNADSALVHQRAGGPTRLFVGDAGNMLELSESTLTDQGSGIAVTIETVDLPEVSEEIPAMAGVRTHTISWIVSTAPPGAGQAVTVTLIDSDDSSNTAVASVTHTNRETRIPLKITARRFRIRWVATMTQDYDIIAFGYTGQVLSRPFHRMRELGVA